MTDCNFKEPQDLKDILELLEKLSSGSISGAVLLKLEGEAQKYFKDSDGLTDLLGTVFTKANFIRRSILKSPQTYDTYSHLTGGHTDCAEKVAEALLKFLPQGYAALLFMLFNCDSGMTKYSLGEWSGQNVNESGLSNNDLCNWLTKEKTLKPLTPGLIRRGFSTGNLAGSNTGETVATVIKNIIKHESPEALQNVFFYLMFVSPWDHSLLGHALCFLSMFCVTVQSHQNNFKGYSEELKDVCLGLSGSLQPFVSGSSQSHISAVSQGGNVYSGVFKDDSLDDYCDWLKKNLKNIIQSLKAMSSDCKTWGTTTPFEYGFTAGPFLYGFVPKKTDWMNHIDKNLPPKIKSLTASLEKLEKALQTSSAAATAGGVFTGLFGLGGAGAGAAYATNAFGFQNFITSLISGLLK